MSVVDSSASSEEEVNLAEDGLNQIQAAVFFSAQDISVLVWWSQGHDPWRGRILCLKQSFSQTVSLPSCYYVNQVFDVA